MIQTNQVHKLRGIKDIQRKIKYHTNVLHDIIIDMELPNRNEIEDHIEALNWIMEQMISKLPTITIKTK